tara:strand:- start:12 stop:608 length:597 start_codon:yes stop_codon:yes gene_type:complete
LLKISNILASSSPRRKKLLEKIGLSFSIEESNVVEKLTLDLPPHKIAKHWAREKAKNVSTNNINSIVIGADTIVNFENFVFGKPKNEEESIKMLKFLSGKTHQVITGVSLIYNSLNMEYTFHNLTQVTFQSYGEEEILQYIETEKPYDKAGSYGIQDSFAKHVQSINGCYYNVVGLPLSSFYYFYKKLNEKIKGYEDS